MDYIAYHFVLNPLKPLNEILVSELAELPFESFSDSASGVSAFVPAPEDAEQKVREVVASLAHLGELKYTREHLADQNWNAQWESDYPVVQVGAQIIVRAPFHAPAPEFPLEVLINPQMSFGTGHHATTWLMLRLLADEDCKGRTLLDMGSGTGVLAIAAAKMGAAKVWAIDIEDWAYRNTVDNVALNEVEIEVLKGDVQLIAGHYFEIILANINKNVLKQDMAAYANALPDGRVLMLSGFFETDIPEILAEAEKYKMNKVVADTRDQWAALKLIKSP